MAALDPVMPVVRHPRDIDELVAQVDEGVALAFAAQAEIEDPPVPFERLVDVADLDRDMVDADQARLFAVRHVRPPSWSWLDRIWPKRRAARKQTGSPRRHGEHGVPNSSFG